MFGEVLSPHTKAGDYLVGIALRADGDIVGVGIYLDMRINIERDIINSDIVLGIILILSFFTIFFNFKIGFTIFYYLNFLGILIINHVASFYYSDIHKSALENAPYNLKNVISHQNKIKYTFL